MRELAQQAMEAMLTQQPVTLTHPAGWQRNGFPLPIKREKANEDGSTTQTYRPLAIFEYIQEQLALAAAAERMKDRASEAGGEEEQNAQSEEA